MAELKVAKRELEQEVDTHKTRLRLHMEAQVRLTLHESASLELQRPFVSRVVASRPPSACVFQILIDCGLVLFRTSASIHLRLGDLTFEGRWDFAPVALNILNTLLP